MPDGKGHLCLFIFAFVFGISVYHLYLLFVLICQSHLLPVLLLAQVGEVIIAKEAVGNAALANPLLAKHYKPDVHSQLFEIRMFKDF